MGNKTFPPHTVLLKSEVPTLSTNIYFDVKGSLFIPTSPVVCISLGTEVWAHNNFVHLTLSLVGVVSLSIGRQSVNSTELWVVLWSTCVQ
jgi:hypothetical protein